MSRRRALSALTLICIALASSMGCDAPTLPPRDCSLERAARAFVVLPDTQFYACAYPEIFQQQTQWIVDHKAQLGLGLVLHTGDIVDDGGFDQWELAASALHTLDRQLPYLLVSGNHDLDAARGSLLDQFFHPDELGNGGCTLLEPKTPGQLDNSFAIVTLRGRPWLFIGIEFAPRDATLDWANDVLRAHAALPAVLFTHAYLYSDDTRYDRAIQPLQPFHPDFYEVTPEQGIGDGQDIWEHVVLPNRNVQLVLSGHVIPDGTARGTATRDDGSVVHEVLTNYQSCDLCPCAAVEGGGGYLRIFELDEAGESVHVSTYSPYLDRSLTDSENDFVLDLTPF